jgi:hypothetical protein
VEEVFTIKSPGSQVNESDPHAAEYISSSASQCCPFLFSTSVSKSGLQECTNLNVIIVRTTLDENASNAPAVNAARKRIQNFS